MGDAVGWRPVRAGAVVEASGKAAAVAMEVVVVEEEQEEQGEQEEQEEQEQEREQEQEEEQEEEERGAACSRWTRRPTAGAVGQLAAGTPLAATAAARLSPRVFASSIPRGLAAHWRAQKTAIRDNNSNNNSGSPSPRPAAGPRQARGVHAHPPAPQLAPPRY